jgi:hypothetical protein
MHEISTLIYSVDSFNAQNIFVFDPSDLIIAPEGKNKDIYYLLESMKRSPSSSAVNKILDYSKM